MEKRTKDWDDVIYSVLIEMDQMFAILDRTYSSASEESSMYVSKISLTFKENLRKLDESAKKDGLTNGNSKLFGP